MARGGRYNRTFEEYHAIPEGWDVVSILSEHKRLAGTYDVRPVKIPEHWSPWFKYRQTLYNIADGVLENDPACVELALRFIELHFIGSYSGYIRSLLARRLKHAILAEVQRQRLSKHFMNMVRTRNRCYEFDDYLGLWRAIIQRNELEVLQGFVNSVSSEEKGFGAFLLQKLKFDFALETDAQMRQST